MDAGKCLGKNLKFCLPEILKESRANFKNIKMNKINLSKYNILKQEKGEGIIATIKTNPGDLILMWELPPRVKFTEIKDNNWPTEDPVIRIMKSSNGCKIQFRATQGLGKWGKGAPKHLIAAAHFSITDLEYILEYLKK